VCNAHALSFPLLQASHAVGLAPSRELVLFPIRHLIDPTIGAYLRFTFAFAFAFVFAFILSQSF
jgi:hypothetical protein